MLYQMNVEIAMNIIKTIEMMMMIMMTTIIIIIIIIIIIYTSLFTIEMVAQFI